MCGYVVENEFPQTWAIASGCKHAVNLIRKTRLAFEHDPFDEVIVCGSGINEMLF